MSISQTLGGVDVVGRLSDPPLSGSPAHAGIDRLPRTIQKLRPALSEFQRHMRQGGISDA